MKQRRRKKAWIGAAISAASGIASAIIGNIQQRKAAKAQQEAEEKQAKLDEVRNVNQRLSNIDINEDTYKDKVSFKTGGRFNTTKVSHARRYKCGGRNKAQFGIIQVDPSQLTVGNANVVQQPQVNTSTQLQVQPPAVTVPTQTNNGPLLSNTDIDGIINGVGNLASTLIRSKRACGGSYKSVKRR